MAGYTDAGHEAAEQAIKRMSARLEKIYSGAAKELGGEWKTYLKSLEAEGEMLKKAIDEAKDEKSKAAAMASYQKYMRLRTVMNERYNSLTEQLAGDISRVNEIAAQYINGQTPEVYAANWNWSGKNIERQSGMAIRFDIVNPNTVKNLASEDQTFLPRFSVDPKKDIPWNTEKLNSAVAQGIVKGDSIPQIAGRLQDVCGMNEKSAVRAARTVVTSAENKARQDTAEAAQKRGVIMYKRWIATHDSRVRDWHEKAGKRYDANGAIPLDDMFEVGPDALMYPADPNGMPENVYNCRCATAHVVKGFTSILPPEKRGKVRVTIE